jgi:four helix bundle protein
VQPLEVHERSAALARELHLSVRAWDAFDRWTIGKQLVTAAASVPANFAEGLGRESDADRRRFLIIARGSARETEHWIDHAEALELGLPADASGRMREVSRMLNGLLRRHQIRR